MSSFSVWFKGLRGRLLTMVALPIVILGAASTLSYNVIEHLVHSLSQASLVRLPLATHAGAMDAGVHACFRYIWTVYTIKGNVAERNKYIEKGRNELAKLKEAHDEYMKLPRSPRMVEIYKPAEEHFKPLVDGIEEAFALMAKHTPEDNEAAHELLTTKLRAHSTVVGKVIDEMAQVRQETAKAEAEEQAKDSEFKVRLLIGSAIGASLLLLLVGLFIAQRLANALTKVSSDISSAGDQVAAASTQLSTASQQVSSGSTEAASSLEETVSSIEELSSMVKLNADNARQAASLAQSSSRSAEEGEQEIRKLISAMSDISQSSKKIEEIINVIDDIAFQTNLLALNAAVEAARAGEQGKGFAVVAEAVRSLAQRSASAAKDITVLIKDGVTKTEGGTRIADSSGAVLKNIVTSIKKVADLNNEIASASAEQANGIGQISKAMNELDASTQQNAAASEEVASSSEEMSSQAIVLKGLVAELSQVITGDRIAAAAQAAGAPGAQFAPASSGARRPQAAGRAVQRPKLVSHAGGKQAPRGASAEEIIPLGDEAPVSKVGTTEGF